MSYLIRQANSKDSAQLGKLLVAYMRETYHIEWGGRIEQLEQDISGGAIKIIVAETGNNKIIGFAAWTKTYDLHWCLQGGLVVDFYVAPANRGTSAAVFLIIELAAVVQKYGGTFLQGGAIENEIVRRLYKRIASVQPNGECYISGRAFRHLAELTSKSWREIVKDLPKAEWNYQS